jgi:cysteine desulfurase/selenocysteine lyase
MIKDVSLKTTYAGLPHKFEAGTPNVAGGIVLNCRDYMNEVGFENKKTRT